MLFLLLCISLCSLSLGDDVEDVEYSPERSFQTKPFTLKLSSKSDFSGLSIKYTIAYNPSDVLNLQPPPAGTVYKDPIPINRTCLVLSYVYNSSYTSMNRTVHSYFFLSDVVQQPVWYAPNLAANGVANITKGLLAIPTLSFSSTAAYPTDYNNGGTWDYPPSTPNPRWGAVEWVDPNSKDNWRQNVEFDIYGGSSRSFPKKSLRIRFRQGNLKFPLFDGFDSYMPDCRYFRSLDLRSHSSDGVFGNLQGRYWGSYLRNVFTDVASHESNNYAPHSRNAHVFFNTYYYGLYHIRERFTSDYIPTYFGGTPNNYEFRSTERSTGVDVRYESPVYVSEIYPPAKQNYANIDKWIEWDNFFFFTILEHVGRNYDLSYTHNWQGGGPNITKPWQLAKGGWKFFPNDYDLGYDVSYAGNPVVLAVDSLIVSLTSERNPDFMIKFQDAQWKFMYKPGSALSPERAAQIFQEIEARESYEYLMYAETARWGYLAENFWNKNFANFDMSLWRSVRTNMYASIPYLHNLCKTFYSSNNWLNTIGAVQFSLQNKQIVDPSTKLTLTHASPVYYTTDGTDPRVAGGGISPSAVQGNSVTITQATLVTARARASNGNWGVIDSVLIKVSSPTCAMCKNVLITEIHYEPENSGKSHFIELKNIGTKDLLLTGSVLSLNNKNNFTFPPATIKAGAFYVLNLFNEEFKSAYGNYGDANAGLLLFSSDDIALYDSIGNLVHLVTFKDKVPWSDCAKGMGYSLILRPESYAVASALSTEISSTSVKCWRYSASKGGSPWKDDPAPADEALRAVYVNWSYISYEENWIEIRNPTSLPIDLSGWTLRDGYIRDGATNYHFNDGTVVQAGDKIKIKVPKKEINLSRKHPLYLFNIHPTLKAHTGEFIVYNPDDFVLKAIYSS